MVMMMTVTDGAADREVFTADDVLSVELCTSLPGLEHDYRLFVDGTERMLRCVWCHVRACGDDADIDPCIEPYHHSGVHRTQAGTRWEVGGHRPNRIGEHRFGY